MKKQHTNLNRNKKGKERRKAKYTRKVSQNLQYDMRISLWMFKIIPTITFIPLKRVSNMIQDRCCVNIFDHTINFHCGRNYWKCNENIMKLTFLLTKWDFAAHLIGCQCEMLREQNGGRDLKGE